MRKMNQRGPIKKKRGRKRLPDGGGGNEKETTITLLQKKDPTTRETERKPRYPITRGKRTLTTPMTEKIPRLSTENYPITRVQRKKIQRPLGGTR